VARALEPFRTKALLGGQWNPRRGASLKTYFVHACLIKFVDVAENWLKHERDIVEELRDAKIREPIGWLATADATPVEHDIIAAESLSARLALVTRLEARQALVMQQNGYSVPNIARHLGVTSKAAERMLEYAKTQLRRLA
jgi:hypothetical protein